MRLLENISLALASLRASKMRALLTMLGIIIGIGAVIAIYTVGNSLSLSITDAMDEFGVNQVQVQIYPKDSNANWEASDADYITQDMIDGFVARNQDDIESVIVYENVGSGQAKKGRVYSNVSITGLAEGGVEDEGAKLLRGRDITERDIKGAKYVAVVSDRYVEKMLPKGTEPLGAETQVHTTNYGILNFVIVGVYEFELPAFMASFVSDEDISSNFLIPVTTAKRITGANDGFYFFSVKIKPEADSFEVADNLEAYFEELYENNPNTTVITQNMEGIANQMTSMLNTVSVAISIIAGISLVVGGIGVMNIMLVSVTERTREIGTRKALGARSSAIRFQFIVEAIIICLIGGVIGIIFGLVLGFAGSSLLGFPAKPSIPIIVIAVMFSMVIGVFFGYYPANKAAKLDPIEALRYE